LDEKDWNMMPNQITCWCRYGRRKLKRTDLETIQTGERNS
jgi:hypothetical protein